MIKIAKEQAVMAEVAGAVGSLVDLGVLKLASEEHAENLIKVATAYSLEEEYNTPNELVENILAVDAYLNKEASEMDYEEVDDEVEDYDEDAEDAEEDAIQEVLKEASDLDEAMDIFAELNSVGALSDATMDKIASVYEAGELEKIAEEASNSAVVPAGKVKDKTPLKQRLGVAAKKAKIKMNSKWNSLSPKAQKILKGTAKGTGIAAGLGAAAGVGAYAGYKKAKKNQ